jgi:hypothetical protein
MAQSVRYCIEKQGDQWHLKSIESGQLIMFAQDRDELVLVAESIVRDVGGEVVVQSHDDGTEAVIRHRGR